MSDRAVEPPKSAVRSSLAFRVGRWTQAVLLALAIAAVVLRLLQSEAALQFRYGGF